MKKLTIKMVTPVLALVVFIVLTTALAEPGADPVSGTGAAVANMNTGQATGVATLVVRGVELSATVAVQLGIPSFSDEGVLHAESSHTFTFANGTITTSDKIVGEPVNEFGLFALNEKLTIVSGTEDFEGVSGNLTVHGQLQFLPPPANPEEPQLAIVTYDVRGEITSK
jgi:hypothetical protein